MSRTTGSVKVTQGIDVTGATVTNSGTLTLPTSTTTIVGRDTTDTLTNKTLTAPAIATITNGGTLTLPSGTDTIVSRTSIDTLTNKTLTAPVISTIVNTGTLTLPTATTTIVGRDTTDTFTTKTITGTTNTVDANSLRNGSTWVVPLGGVAPVTNQIFTYNGTAGVWTSLAENNTTSSVQTTSATVTTLETLATVTDRTYLISSSVVARRSDAGSESASYILKASFRNNIGTVTQMGTTDRLQFEDVAGWDASFTISGTDILVSVTGEAAKTIQWKSVTTTVTSN